MSLPPLPVASAGQPHDNLQVGSVLQEEPPTIECLSDGVLVARMLHELCVTPTASPAPPSPPLHPPPAPVGAAPPAEPGHRSAPETFAEDKLKKITPSHNPTIRVSNLRKVKRAMLLFFEHTVPSGVAGLQVPDEAAVEVRMRNIARAPRADPAVQVGDVGEAIKLLELLLGCAVHSAAKDRHVTHLMGLGEEVVPPSSAQPRAC